MYFIGIDIAKRFHEASVIDEKGNIIIKRIKFQNSYLGYCKLMDAVRKLKFCRKIFTLYANFAEIVFSSLTWFRT